MTNEEAAVELERIANICHATPLSIASAMGANALKDKSNEYERGKADGRKECIEWLKKLMNEKGARW